MDPIDDGRLEAVGEARAKHAADPRSLLLLAAALASLGVLLAALRLAEQPPRTLDAIEPPQLPVADARCATPPGHGRDAGAAARRARQAARAAGLQMARYPFAPAAGLRALFLLSEARDCAARASAGNAGAPGDDVLAARAERYRARIETDYRDHVLRARRAAAAGTPALAAADIAYLMALLHGTRSAFSAELRSMQLALAASGDAP